jgi:iduronate 2-sulfatase
MNRIGVQALMAFTAAMLLTLPAALQAADAPRKWNVLFLMADDWRPEMACYGTPGMISPNVDKLAADGVRFDRAYCQFPVCNPSRTSLLTGRYPTQTGNIFNGDHHFRPLHPDFVTLPQYFKQHGYVTANAGKIFHGKAQDPPSWTEWIEDGVPREARRAASATQQTTKPAPPDNEEGAGAAGVRRVVLVGDGESDKDYWIAINGIKLLEKYKDQPFFIGIGFHRPHAIPTAPQKYFELYDVEKMPLPPDFAPRPALPKEIPATALPKDNDAYMNDEVSPQTAREVLLAYRASATWVDWNIGRVLDALDRLGLADKTIVVLIGDHG